MPLPTLHQSSYRRILDAEPCTLDELVFREKTETEPAVAVETGGLDDGTIIYWLCYDDQNDELSVKKTPKPPSWSSIHIRVLRLALRNSPPSRIADANIAIKKNDDNDTKKSNVGTKILFSDDAVRIWEFRLRPQEQCDYHVHELRYCFTNLSLESDTQELSETKENIGLPRRQVQGQTIYVGPDSLGSHAVRNVGTTMFLQFIVEFKW